MKRPPLTSSIVAAILASRPGGWKPAQATSGPSSTRSVTAASGESRVHAPHGPRSGCPYNRWSPSQIESNPTSSAATAMARYSGQRTSRSTSGSWTPTRTSRGLYAHDERDRGNDDPRAQQGRDGDRLRQDEPAEGDRDDRVHVGVGRDLRDRGVLQQPRVGREGQQRPEGDQVGEAEDRARRELGELHVADLAAGDADERDREPAQQRLPGGGDERI